ncbi:C4-dicarboxylate TRAP transporter substrate-binding protein [Oricola nitratireducens]|uniref:C4-dicarboxylate TRAP transporter substrate-binding protein n=1 Tax=Oricola nitratireducens TaxID=2775868 RepID=UPI0018683815|nr:C4-dicarboxylate TRAP transporter substrate-binding protein [Oricola nitratireducens]
MEMKSVKKTARLALISTALAFGLAAGVSGAALSDEVKLNSWLGPTHPLNSGGYVPFIDAVEKASNDDIKFRLFLGGSLLDSRATLPGIRDNVVEGGFVVLSFHPAEFPAMTTFSDLSMVGTDSLTAAAAVTETILLHCKPCEAEAKAQNFLFFGAYATTAYNIMSVKPVNSLEDMHGKKVRSFGGAIDRWLSSLGAVAVNVDATHAYDGLSKNTLDAVMLPVADLSAYNLWDVAPYVTLLNVGSFKADSSVGFSRDFWRGLTTEQRALLLKYAPIMAIGPGLDYIKNDEKVVAEASGKGVTLIQPTDEMKKGLADFFEVDKSAILEAAAKRGVSEEDTSEIVATYVKLLDKYNKLFEGKRDDPQALYDILYQEVYAKLDPATFGLD